ncbi:MAG: hypothetical protein NTX79_03090 [Candidatus Micrarchaeota archaeon]|nr:hypothetical protein [Candidatus Micrarchaeota archaeon]
MPAGIPMAPKPDLTSKHFEEMAELSDIYLTRTADAVEFSEDGLLSNLRALYNLSRQQGKRMKKAHAKKIERLAINADMLFRTGEPGESHKGAEEAKQPSKAPPKGFMQSAQESMRSKLYDVALAVLSSTTLSKQDIKSAKQTIGELVEYYKKHECADVDLIMRLLPLIDGSLDAGKFGEAKKRSAELCCLLAVSDLGMYFANPSSIGSDPAKIAEIKGHLSMLETQSIILDNATKASISKFIDNVRKYLDYSKAWTGWYVGKNCQQFEETYRKETVFELSHEQINAYNFIQDEKLEKRNADAAIMKWFNVLSGSVHSEIAGSTRIPGSEIDRKIGRLYVQTAFSYMYTMNGFKKLDAWDAIGNAKWLQLLEMASNMEIMGVPISTPNQKEAALIKSVSEFEKAYKDFCGNYPQLLATIKIGLSSGNADEVTKGMEQLSKYYVDFMVKQMDAAMKVADYDLKGIKLAMALFDKAMDVAMVASLATGVGEMAAAGRLALSESSALVRSAAANYLKEEAAGVVSEATAAALRNSLSGAWSMARGMLVEMLSKTGAYMAETGVKRALKVSVLFTSLGLYSDSYSSKLISNALNRAEHNQVGGLKDLLSILQTARNSANGQKFAATLDPLLSEVEGNLHAAQENLKKGNGSGVSIEDIAMLFIKSFGQMLVLETGFGAVRTGKSLAAKKEGFMAPVPKATTKAAYDPAVAISFADFAARLEQSWPKQAGIILKRQNSQELFEELATLSPEALEIYMKSVGRLGRIPVVEPGRQAMQDLNDPGNVPMVDLLSKDGIHQFKLAESYLSTIVGMCKQAIADAEANGKPIVLVVPLRGSYFITRTAQLAMSYMQEGKKVKLITYTGSPSDGMTVRKGRVKRQEGHLWDIAEEWQKKGGANIVIFDEISSGSAAIQLQQAGAKITLKNPAVNFDIFCLTTNINESVRMSTTFGIKGPKATEQDCAAFKNYMMSFTSKIREMVLPSNYKSFLNDQSAVSRFLNDASELEHFNNILYLSQFKNGPSRFASDFLQNWAESIDLRDRVAVRQFVNWNNGAVFKAEIVSDFNLLVKNEYVQKPAIGVNNGSKFPNFNGSVPALLFT